MTSFSELHDHLTALGIEVGITRTPAGHAIRLSDGRREIRMPVVDADFDAAARLLVLSARLRERLGTDDIRTGGTRVVGRWPELAT